MKNKDTWEFAHKKLGKIWWSLGWLLLVITLLAMVLLLGKDKDTVGGIGSAICLLQLVPMLASIYPVEKALKETFDEKGMRR